MAEEYVTGYLHYNEDAGRYGLFSNGEWADWGLHCGEPVEIFIDDEWVKTRMNKCGLSKDEIDEWYLVGTPYKGNLEQIQARMKLKKLNFLDKFVSEIV